MLQSTNIWMGVGGLVYLVAGIVVLRNDLAAARAWDRLILLGPVFIAASLACFAPEHFHGGPDYIQQMAPTYMPVRWFWPYFIGCCLLAAATSLTLRRGLRLSTVMLGFMFFGFVCMIYLPSVLRHPTSRFAWAIFFRDLSFCAGAWALASVEWQAALPQLSKSLALFARIILIAAAFDYGAQHFLHPDFSPGVPLQLKALPFIPLPDLWAYVTGAVLLGGGIALSWNKTARMGATAIGALMTALTLALYLPMLMHASGVEGINEGISYLADTLLYAGSALALALALPRSAENVTTS